MGIGNIAANIITVVDSSNSADVLGLTLFSSSLAERAGSLKIFLFDGILRQAGNYSFNDLQIVANSQLLLLSVSLPTININVAPVMHFSRSAMKIAQNVSFSTPQREVVGGRPPITFLLLSGTLPTGVRLNNQTAQLTVRIIELICRFQF